MISWKMSSYRSSKMNLLPISRGYPNEPPIIAASSIVTSYILGAVFLSIFRKKQDVRTFSPEDIFESNIGGTYLVTCYTHTHTLSLSKVTIKCFLLSQ